MSGLARAVGAATLLVDRAAGRWIGRFLGVVLTDAPAGTLRLEAPRPTVGTETAPGDRGSGAPAGAYELRWRLTADRGATVEIPLLVGNADACDVRPRRGEGLPRALAGSVHGTLGNPPADEGATRR